MPLMKLCAALIVLASLPAAGQQITPADVEAQKNVSTRNNARLVSSLGKEAAASLGREAYRNVVGPAPVASGPSITAITLQTQKAIDSHDLSITIAKGNNVLIKTAVGVGTSLGTANPVMGVVVGELVSASLDGTTEALEKAGKEAIQRNLKTNLDDYLARTSQQEFNDLLASPDPLAFRQKLEAKVGNVFGTELDTLPAEQQQIVNSFYDRQVANLLTAGLATVSQFQAVQAAEIETNRKNIKGLALAFAEYADVTNERLDGILQTQQELQTGLKNLTDRVANTERGVEFLQNAMFSKMPPAEQLAALRQGIFPNMPVDERLDLEQKIEVVAKRQELVDRVGSYLNGAQELTNIARNLGVDPEILKTADKAVAIGQNAVAAFTAFSTGNYLSAISSVSSIFGVGAPDVAGERHAEIMGTLNRMFDKLNVIEGKIDELLKGQQMILQTQLTIIENIATLANQVQKNHDETMERLHELHNDVLYNRTLMASEASRKYSKCFDVVNPGGVRIIDTANGVLPTHAQFGDLFLDERARLRDCMEQIDTTRDANLDFLPTVFALRTHQATVDSAIGPYLRDVFDPAFAILTNSLLTSDNKTPAARVTSLFAPMETVGALNAKLAIVAAENPARFKRPVVALTATALAVPVVLMHGKFVSDIHYYYLLTDAFDRPHTLQALFRGDGVRMTGRTRLQEALSLTDIAIAQQTMLGGDALLPLLMEILTRFRASQVPAENDLHKAAVDLLQKNSVLAHNLVLYGVSNHVRKHSNISSYFVARAGSDVATLQPIVGDVWTLAFHAEEIVESGRLKQPKGWSVKIGRELIALPTGEELIAGRFQEWDDLRPLVSMRRRLVDELSTYEVYETASSDMRRQMNGIILREMAKPTRPRP